MNELTRITERARWTLRPATRLDTQSIATVWHQAWRDGHLGHVPEGLLAYRGPEHFLASIPSRLADTTVATLDGQVLGFVAVEDDELELLFVAEVARGSGAAAALLRYGENVIASAGFERAWLAVATGNARARRFYAREGWRDAGAFDYPAPIEGGSFLVPCHRYEKQVIRRPD